MMTRDSRAKVAKRRWFDVSVPPALIILLVASAFEIPLGFILETSLPALLTFAVFLAWLCFAKPSIAVTYSWYIVMAALSVVGTYSCDSGAVDLYEISRMGYYANATSTLVFMHMAFFFTLLLRGDDKAGDGDGRRHGFMQPYGRGIAYCALAAALLIEVYLVLNVYDKPYFALGLNRLSYASNLTGLASTLKGWLPIFIPPAIIVAKRGNKLFPALFFLGMVFIYIWTGDKFGTYVFAASIVIYCVFDGDSLGSKGKAFKLLTALLALALALFLVGMFQRLVLYGTDFNSYIEYLMERLAQQGQIWWSVFEKTIGDGVAISELPEGMLASLADETARVYPYAGQWKMMLVASDYSTYVQQRVASAVPYTTTTQATLFYYFGWFGVVAMPLFAVVCKRLISALLSSVSCEDCLISMLLVKLILAFNSLYSSSDIAAIFNPVNICILVSLYLLTTKGPAPAGATARSSARLANRG